MPGRITPYVFFHNYPNSQRTWTAVMPRPSATRALNPQGPFFCSLHRRAGESPRACRLAISERAWFPRPALPPVPPFYPPFYLCTAYSPTPSGLVECGTIERNEPTSQQRRCTRLLTRPTPSKSAEGVALVSPVGLESILLRRRLFLRRAFPAADARLVHLQGTRVRPTTTGGSEKYSKKYESEKKRATKI